MSDDTYTYSYDAASNRHRPMLHGVCIDCGTCDSTGLVAGGYCACRIGQDRRTREAGWTSSVMAHEGDGDA